MNVRHATRENMTAGKRPRILWDMTFAARSLTGTRVYTQNLFQALHALGQAELQALDATPDAASRAKGGVSGSARKLWWLANGLERTLDAQRPDLFHAAAYLGPRRAPCPTLVNVFDVAYLTYPQYFDWKWNFYARTVIPRTVRQAAAVLTLSEPARGEIIKAYGVAAERVHIVAPGVGAEFRPFTDKTVLAARRAEFGLNENYLLYVGEPNARKNIPALIGAFAQLRAEFPDLQLVLAGPRMAQAKAVQRALDAYGVTLATRVLGYVPQAALPGLYAGARALVYASKVEGFGMPPVEALACGTPVVAAPNPPLPQVLGDAGYFAEDDSPAALAQALGVVLRDDALAQRLRARGLARAREFTWARAARATMQIYTDVLRAGPPRASDANA